MKPFAILLSLCHAVTAGTISGRVFDPSGAAVAGAKIRVVQLDAAQQNWSTGTAGDGRFEIISLPEGNFELQVLAPGFAFYRRGASLRGADPRVEINAVMRMGEIQESIKVTAPGRPASAGPQRIRVGGNIQPARLLSQVRPEYPESAKRAGTEGTAVFRAVIGKDGAVADLAPMTGVDKELSGAAAAAIRQWKYQPALLNGQPVEIVTVVEVAFRLSE